LGVLYARENDLERAESCFGEAYRLDPNGPAGKALERLRSMKKTAVGKKK